MAANIEIGGGKEKKSVPRSEWLHPDSIFREPPCTGHGDYIASAWEEAGRCTPGDYAPRAITWRELESYSNMTAPIKPWEAVLIVEMSRVYCHYVADTDRLTPAPYTSTDDEAELARERGRQNEYAMRAR